MNFLNKENLKMLYRNSAHLKILNKNLSLNVHLISRPLGSCSEEYHLKHIVSTVKLTLEEMSTVLTQIEACLNSRPLVPVICDEDGFEPLTPGHFLIGRSLDSLPDHSLSYRSIPLLCRWHLCQNLV